MKQIYISVLALLCSFATQAQDGAMQASSFSTAAYMHKIPALSSMDNIISATGFEDVAPPKRRGSNTFVPGKGLPAGPDPLAKLQEIATTTAGRAPIASFDAHLGTVLNDPTGAIGPNHYVYAFNSGFGILDRAGNVLLPEASLGTLFPGETLGDPVVVYDRFANRFIIMQFSNTPNGFLVAVCQGPDPVNDGWYTYRFNTGTFPDYEKMSVWGDGYYITANKNQGSQATNDVVFALERDEMLVGNASSQMIGFPLPGVEDNGFYSPGGFNAIGASLPPVGVPHPIVYMQDDGWSGISTDHLKVWNISTDWSVPSNSSISSPQQINTAAFDATFNGGSFQNLDEPGSGPNIDAIQATMMYMTNYRRFGTHNSAVMNFVVDVSGNDTKAGIRWYELRQANDTAPWTIYQEGTYSQPNHSAFCASISMDSSGNIGLGYTIVSSTQYTSLRYTGRQATDPLGTMTIAEQFIVDGDAVTNRPDGRYGDYSQLTVDPLDDETFWHIGEYMKGPSSVVRRSHVASFKIATGPPDTEAPSDPTSLAASGTTATSTDLNWNASTDNVAVVGYDVYQNGINVATASSNNYSVTGLTPNTAYSFYVIAKDATGNESGQSNTVNITTLDTAGCTGGITAFPYSESFENTIGAWSQDSGDDLDWVLLSGTTPSGNTGPSSANDGTYYIYVEASGNGTGYPNKRAIINSPCYDLSGESEASFNFDYHQFGSSDMGAITLQASTDNGINWTTLWSQTGNQGNAWNSVSIDMAAFVGASVQLRFDRVTGGTWQADIALDNVSMTAGGGGPTGCTGGITSFPYSEGFENTIGAWTQNSGDDLNWTVDASGTPSSNTGPSSATEGTYYIFVEASGNGTGYPTKQAIITSPCFDLSGESEATFSFKYHMFGSTDAGSITLEASGDNGSAWSALWSQTGNQGNQWNTVDVDLAAYIGGGVQLRFNRVTGGTWQADVAIDDVSLTNGGGSTGNDCAAASLTLDITFDNYPEETAWTLQNSGGATVASGSYSTANPDGSSITENISGLASGDYTFTITDAFGDGICCAFGNGSYTLSSSEGVIVTGGSFSSSEATAFCVDATKAPLRTFELNDASQDAFTIYPNPVVSLLEVDTQGLEVQDVRVFNAFGIQVKQASTLEPGNTINVSTLATGTYFIRIVSGDMIVTRKFIKE